MTLLDVDPNLVKPGWTPLLIILLLGVVMVFLFLSMRRQFRKINVPGEPDAGSVEADDEDHPAPRPHS